MNPARSFASISKCPRCSFRTTASTTICDNCGSFVPFEEAAYNTHLLHWCRAALGRRLSDVKASEIAFVLACIPLVIGPAVAAVIIVLANAIKDRSRLGEPEWQRPIVIATINIVFSLLLWRFVTLHVWDLLVNAIFWLKSLSPYGGSTPGIRITPVGFI